MEETKSLAELHELAVAVNAGKPLPQKVIAAAADDAYREQQYTLAYELYRALKAPGPYQLYRRALSALNVGAIGLAEQVAEQIGEPTPEMTTGQIVDIECLPGRIAKEKWLRSSGHRARELARQSAEAYAAVMTARHDYFPGINAATMYFAAGEPERGAAIAGEVIAWCEAELERGRSPWVLATLGEAALLTGDPEGAARHYREAAAGAGDVAAMVGSMRRQLRVLRRILKEIPAPVSQALHAGTVVAFTGHMIDHPERDEVRFPAYLEAAVGARIEERLETLGAGHGFCSAACGSDLLFIEALNDRGARANIVLPFPRSDFVHASVAFAGESWVERFENCLAKNPVEEVTGEPFLGEDTLFEHGNAVLLGNAINFAQQIGADLVLLAALDLEAEPRQGGAQATVQRARERGIPIELIDIGELRRATPAGASVRRTAPAAPEAAPWTRILKEESHREVRTMLFADVVGFSRIPEHQSPAFFLHFLREIANTVEQSEREPLLANTWGDGLYVVYDDVLAAADFALRLRDAVAQRDWEEVGLPPTSVRIGMHSGPVFLAHDPVIKRRNAFGSHVNRAARIEPVTASGAVFSSAAAAALIVASASREFACDYLGLIELAKKYDRVPLYRLRRADEIE